MSSSARFFSVLCLLASACGPETVAPTDSGAGDTTELSLAVTIGQGEFGYEALASGDAITLVHGPQGGWHIEVAGRVSGTHELVRVHTTVYTSDGTQIGGEGQENAGPVQLASFANNEGDFFKSRAFLDDQPVDQAYFCALHGSTLSLTVTVTDLVTEMSASSSLDVVASPDAVDAVQCTL